VIGWLVWGNVPDLIAVAGIVLVCAGGIISIVFGGSSGKGHPIGHGHWTLFRETHAT